MSEFIFPIATEPLISEEALNQVSFDVLEKGLFTTGFSASALLLEKEVLFARHMEDIANELTIKSPINVWPARTLYIGVGLAHRAYKETGYHHRIDDGIKESRRDTFDDGARINYISCLLCDPTLSLLLDISSESKELEAYVGKDMQRTLAIGAGCYRFYLQRAVVAD